jgi:hypothetical protein
MPEEDYWLETVWIPRCYSSSKRDDTLPNLLAVEMNGMNFVPYKLLVRRARYVIIYVVQ